MPSTISLVRAATLACALAALSGCNTDGHGKYTQEHINVAKEKMAMLKSGTEWQMGQQQFLAGDFNKALKSVERSLTLNPNVPKSHVLRGRILMELGRLEEARQEFATAEELDPNNVDAQYYAGIVHERVGQPDLAIARYRRAIELDSGNAQYVIAAAEMLVNQGKLDEAETLLTERKEFLQYNAAVRQTLGHIALLHKDAPKAAQLFSEAMLLAPGDPQILEDLVHAQMASSQWAEAEVNITRLLDMEANKDRRDLKQLRARALVALDRPVEARTLFIELTTDKEGGRDVRSWIDLGNVAVLLKDRVNLRLAASRLMAMAPDRADGYVFRALYCRLDNRPEDAVQAIEGACARSKKDATPFIIKAMILQDLNRTGEARDAVAQGVSIDPANRKAQALLVALGGEMPANQAVTSHPEASN